MMGGLNDNHKRHLLTTFEHVDRLLTDALQALNSAEVAAPFQRYAPDSLPIQRKVLADYVARLRALMVRILEEQGVEIPKPRIRSLWAFRNALLSAGIAVEELRPRYMRGYGPLTEDAVRDLETMTSRLAELLDRMHEYLSRDAGPDLEKRLERMEKTTTEVEWARVLEQVITAYGIVELRPSLDAVISRLESTSFEVAVFGRVSSGKSSLLDYILKTDALPIGVTPVTAIPTRVLYGSPPQARIWFAEKEAITVPLGELTQYVTEQSNPNNAKHVTRIHVEIPAERLKDGVTFVDTPGLGSLARYGEMESLAYLPRCDLGIVLVDAASTLVPDDAVVVDALRRAGAEVVVLLTKGDILGAEERTAAAAYVARELASLVGCDVPVHVISVKGRDAELCDRWFDTWLVPRLREHKQLARASLRRKIGLLRDAALAALQRWMDKHSGIGKDLSKEWSAAEAGLGRGLANLESAAREQPAWPDLARRVLDGAARRIADEWRKDGSVQIDAATVVAAEGNEALGAAAAEIAQSLSLLRADLMGALRAASVAAGSRDDDAAEIPALTGMPVADLAGSFPEMPLRRHVLAAVLKRLAAHTIRAHLDKELGRPLETVLDRRLKDLSDWRSRVLAQMRQVFMAKADLYRAQCEQSLVGADSAAVERDIKKLKALEYETQAAVSSEHPPEA